jgi:hypothetical protein
MFLPPLHSVQWTMTHLLCAKLVLGSCGSDHGCFVVLVSQRLFSRLGKIRTLQSGLSPPRRRRQNQNSRGFKDSCHCHGCCFLVRENEDGDCHLLPNIRTIFSSACTPAPLGWNGLQALHVSHGLLERLASHLPRDQSSHFNGPMNLACHFQCVLCSLQLLASLLNVKDW